MQCENSKCKKNITNPYSCNKCEFKFCSNSCMIDHYFDTHQFSNDNSKIKNVIPSPNLKKANKKQSVNSIFIKSGEYLKEIKSDPYYKFENFDKVRMGKKMQVLGAGAFGDVYLVKHKQDGKFFAVKQMNKKKIIESGAKLDIVRREIDIHSRLIHPNIIKLFSHHEDDMAFYLILEYANCGTLFTSIRKSKGLDEKKAFKYFIQTAGAINFIHDNNLIHRDIKPENLLIDENDNIKLCDFGWCIELEIGNRTTFCGTIEYMAPEIIKEMPYDKSIDVWSLGILLYELTHGYSPFRAVGVNEEEEHTQIFKNIIKFKFKIEKASLSKNCQEIITKLLNTDTLSRIKTKDIFTHPWIIDFENEHLQNNKISRSISNVVIDKKENIKQPYINMKNEILPPSISPEKKIREKSADFKKPAKKHSVLEEHREKIKENLQLHKKSSLQNAIDSSTHEFSQFSSLAKAESLFDKVLTQVTDKNKDKRKKSNMFCDQYELGDIEKIIENENKIVLKINREDKQIAPNPKFQSNSKNIKNFEMLNEIKEIDKNLNKHIDEQSRKNELFKNTKDELNSKKNNISNYFHTLEDDDDDFNEYANYYYNTNNSNNNNSKKTTAQSNNLIMLHPKSYFQEEDFKQVKNDKHNLSDMPEKVKKVEIKKTKNDDCINYNDELYLNNKGRNTNKNPKNSAGHHRTTSRENSSREFFISEKVFEDHNPNILAAIELLEKAQENKKEMDIDNKNSKNFWERFSTFMNPFKCE